MVTSTPAEEGPSSTYTHSDERGTGSRAGSVCLPRALATLYDLWGPTEMFHSWALQIRRPERGIWCCATTQTISISDEIQKRGSPNIPRSLSWTRGTSVNNKQSSIQSTGWNAKATSASLHGLLVHAYGGRYERFDGDNWTVVGATGSTHTRTDMPGTPHTHTHAR